MTYSVYKITLGCGGAYIGISTNPQRRLAEHMRHTKRSLGKAIMLYGVIDFRILSTKLTKDEAFAIERFFISRHKTLVPDGYNKELGGKPGALICQNEITSD